MWDPYQHLWLHILIRIMEQKFYLTMKIIPLRVLAGNLRPWCWGLVLKCYELRTRQHKMLNINVLRPLKHYFPKDLMNFGRRL
jgi:hypothetical protein